MFRTWSKKQEDKWTDGGSRDSGSSFLLAARQPPTSTFVQPQKSLSATWCMKAHCLLIQVYVTPDPICTDAIWPSCHHPFWPVEEIQWIFIMLLVYDTRFGSVFWSSSSTVCLEISSLWLQRVQQKWRCWSPVQRDVQSHVLSVSFIWSICTEKLTYWVCLFLFCFKFQQDCCGRFPTKLFGKPECSWTLEFLSFINFGYLSWQSGIVTCEKLACVQICSFQQFWLILLQFWTLQFCPTGL